MEKKEYELNVIYNIRHNGILYNNETLTDAVAEEYLRANPGDARKFSKIPKPKKVEKKQE